MSLSEFELIQRYFATDALGFSRPHVELGIGDDAAAVSVPPGQCLTLAMDVLVESVHFPVAAPPRYIAHRALAANLSDLAAMGSTPLCFTLGLSLPAVDSDWLQDFAAGLAALAGPSNCPLVGGDVTRGPLTVTIQAHGLSDSEHLLTRTGAQPGDIVLVTGNLGDAALGLAVVLEELGQTPGQPLAPLTPAQHEQLRRAYYQPQPRFEFAAAITTLANSAIDISDGLLGDLGHIATASGVAAWIDVERLPLSPALLAGAGPQAAREAALTGGDDYELCLTAAPDQLAAIEAVARTVGLTVSCIGEIQTGEGVHLVDANGKPVLASGQAWEHFRDEGP